MSTPEDDRADHGAPRVKPAADEEAAMYKVVRGNPTPEELAAALAVVQARAAAASTVAAAPTSLDEWADKERNVPRRALPQPGPKAWRSTYWPR